MSPTRPLPTRRPKLRSPATGGCAGLLVVALLCSCTTGQPTAAHSTPPSGSATSSPPPTPGPSAAAAAAPPTNVYAHTRPGMFTATTRSARPLVYVPDSESNRVDIIDPRTYRVVRSFFTGSTPQHVVPSWDLRTLWVNDSSGNEVQAIDPRTGRPGRRVAVTDPYNMYFTPDGRSAMIMAERRRRIDFRDPHTMRLQHSLQVPCAGVNHADFSAGLTFFLASCEFSGDLIAAPVSGRHVSRVIDLNRIRTPGMPSAQMAAMMGGPAAGVLAGTTSMPQDVRLTPDGRTFLVADMLRNGVWLVDARRLRVRGFVPTGRGAHGIYPSRDARSIYVSNRGAGTISVLDAATLRVRTVWRLPGGSPDMGDVSADGRQLWLSGRYNGVVYVIDTRTGRLLHRIRVGAGPHGLCVWPQPGRFSLGHTGNMR